MYPYRRVQRALVLTCTTVAVAAAPATALAMPADPEGLHAGNGSAIKSRPYIPPAPQETSTGGGDQTLALVVSGAALLVALGGAGYAGRTGHRIGQPSH